MTQHTQWFIDTGRPLTTAHGKTVQVWEFRHQPDAAVLSAWAAHFRNHYCDDGEIDALRVGTGLSRTDYLNTFIFPDRRTAPGPSIRAGDFSEILIADFLKYIHRYWVPTTRYDAKAVRNESTKGTDIIGFRFVRDGADSLEDTLAIFETKAQFSKRTATPRLQDAVDDSKKDITRKGESLNAIKRRLYRDGDFDGVNKVERFQNYADRPYTEIYGAVALFDNQFFNTALESTTNASTHPHRNSLCMIVIKGDQMMRLVRELYKRAANEA